MSFIITALINPTNAPTIVATKIDSMIEYPSRIIMEETIPPSASTDPTDKSIPADIITNVIPIAIIPTIDVCLARLPRFPMVKNLSVDKDKTIKKTTRIIPSTPMVGKENFVFFADPDKLSFNTVVPLNKAIFTPLNL